MKKAKYLIILVISMFISISTVNAAYQPGDWIGTKRDFTLNGIRVYRSGGGGDTSYWSHYLNSSNTMICMDPGVNMGGSNVVVVKQLLTNNAADTRAYDAGLAYILRNAGTSNADKVAEAMAVRIYGMFWPTYERSISHENYAYRELIPLYNSWGRSYGNSLVRGATGENFSSKYVYGGYSINSIYTGNNINITSTVKNNANSLIKGALTAARNARQNGLASVTYGSPTVTKNGSNEKTVIRSIKLSGFSGSNARARLNVSCPSCSSRGITYKVYINNEEVSGTVNLLDSKYKLSNGTGSVTLKIVFTGDRASIVCGRLNYSVNINGYADTISTEAYIVKPSNCTSCQQFLVMITKDSEKAFPGDFYVNMCTDCDDLIDLCNDGNDNACDQAIAQDCTECVTKLDNVECSAETQTIGVKEGIEVDARCNLINGNTTPNVKSCIVGKEDVAGNSYHAQTSGYPNNNYCKVYCTENYDIDVPGLQTANSGRYIKLSTKVSGTKTCYTSKINHQQFETDLEAARIALVNQYNSWLYYYNLVNRKPVATQPLSDNYSTGCKTVTGSCEGEGCTPPTTCESSLATCSATLGEHNFTYRDANNVSQHVQIPYGRMKATPCDCDGTSSSCTAIDYMSDYNSRNYPSSLAAEAKKLDNAIATYNNIISEYNSCSGNIDQSATLATSSKSTVWNMTYNFNPKIAFWYEDDYYKIAKDTHLVTDGAAAKTPLTINTCSGEVNNEYSTCTTGWVANSGSTANMGNKTVCYKTGSTYTCSQVAIVRSTANYVVQTQGVNALYELPTQYFTIYPSGKLINEQKDGTSPLENALPISLNKPAGVYNYTLVFEDLGEFYDTGALGRIWGSSTNTTTSTVATALASNSHCKTDGAVNVDKDNPSGAYTCAYKVNCPECTVTCGPNGCVWQECNDNKCTIRCLNCIFTNGSANYSYRTVTTNDLNPNDRELGANWKNDETNITTATELKAFKTTNDIITNGENIYDEDSDEKVLTVELTQSMINDIKAYNKTYVNNGGYASDSLKCYDYTDEDEKVYENVYCYSTFLDEMYNKYEKNMTFTKNRITASGGDASENDSKRAKIVNQCEGGGNCYWTTWTEALNDSRFTVTTAYALTSYKNNYGTDAVNVGPSYR